jgi:trigger factor
MNKGEDWVITAEVTVKPEVKSCSRFKRASTSSSVTSRSCLDTVKFLYSPNFTSGFTAAENGDTVVIDFEGFLGDEAFEGGKGENYSLELGTCFHVFICYFTVLFRHC